jgi:hypothetical protein
MLIHDRANQLETQEIPLKRSASKQKQTKTKETKSQKVTNLLSKEF